MRSDSVKTGTQQAPHRSLLNALGYTEEERRRPMIGIVSSYNEIVPAIYYIYCHQNPHGHIFFY